MQTSENLKCVAASGTRLLHARLPCSLHLLQQVTGEFMEPVAPIEPSQWLSGQAILRPSRVNARHVEAQLLFKMLWLQPGAMSCAWAALLAVLSVTVSLAEPRCSPTSYYKNCWIRRFPGVFVDLEESGRRGAQLLEHYAEESALKCSRTCCLTRNCE